MTDDAEDNEDQKVSLGAVLDGIVGSMTAEQFEQLAKRTGHGDRKEEAAQALAQRVRHGNIETHRLTKSQLENRFARWGGRR